MPPSIGLLLINLGTPDAPNVKAVRRYLRQFLSDPRVMDIPAFPRWLLLNLFILPFRPKKSARAYAKIFDERGSPLLYLGQDLREKVASRLPKVQVELAMRYGNPSIPDIMKRFEKNGIRDIIVFPLYPQRASSTTGSTIEAVNAYVNAQWVTPNIRFVPPFFQHPAFIKAAATPAKALIKKHQPDKVLFSFHGLPERHIEKAAQDSSCLSDNCCSSLNEKNSHCYRAQCFATARALAHHLDLENEDYVVAFQSRMGKIPWIEPHTDQVIKKLAKEGTKKIVALTPAFVTDCLETLEEIGVEARADFLARGGEVFELAPCPNASDLFSDAIIEIAHELKEN